MAAHWTGKWPGGRTYERDGRTVFVVERMRHGRRYTIPLDVGSERQALAELALFERDPEGFATRGEAAEQRVVASVFVGADNVQRFLDHLKREKRTDRYRRNCRYYLSLWAEALAGRDLRQVTLQELKRVLACHPRTSQGSAAQAPPAPGSRAATRGAPGLRAAPPGSEPE